MTKSITQFSKYMLRQNFIQTRFVFVDDYIAMIWTAPIVSSGFTAIQFHSPNTHLLIIST